MRHDVHWRHWCRADQCDDARAVFAAHVGVVSRRASSSFAPSTRAPTAVTLVDRRHCTRLVNCLVGIFFFFCCFTEIYALQVEIYFWHLNNARARLVVEDRLLLGRHAGRSTWTATDERRLDRRSATMSSSLRMWTLDKVEFVFQVQYTSGDDYLFIRISGDDAPGASSAIATPSRSRRSPCSPSPPASLVPDPHDFLEAARRRLTTNGDDCDWSPPLRHAPADQPWRDDDVHVGRCWRVDDHDIDDLGCGGCDHDGGAWLLDDARHGHLGGRDGGACVVGGGGGSSCTCAVNGRGQTQSQISNFLFCFYRLSMRIFRSTDASPTRTGMT
jgi:hypothetical protein